MADTDPTPLDAERRKTPRRLGEVRWSERRGAMLHDDGRRPVKRWLGLTKAEWTWLAMIALPAFIGALVALQLWG